MREIWNAQERMFIFQLVTGVFQGQKQCFIITFLNTIVIWLLWIKWKAVPETQTVTGAYQEKKKKHQCKLKKRPIGGRYITVFRSCRVAQTDQCHTSWPANAKQNHAFSIWNKREHYETQQKTAGRLRSQTPFMVFGGLLILNLSIL